MHTVTKWVVKDDTGQEQIFETYIEAYGIYKDLQEDGHVNVTITEEKKFLLTEG